MSEFTIRSESVDVEQIMKQIRQRVLEKRGADYTEDQIRELASVRLEKFLDPEEPALRPPGAVPQEPAVVRRRHDPSKIAGALHLRRSDAVRLASRLHALCAQAAEPVAEADVQLEHVEPGPAHAVEVQRRAPEARCAPQDRVRRSRAEWNSLYYEVLHNLVLETTRMGIEVQNLRMKVESLSSRLDFSERRVRALEGVVQYRPEVVHGSDRREERDEDHAPAPQASAGSGSVEGFVPAGGGGGGQPGQGDGSARRRRRRRRGRRGGQGDQGASGASGAYGASGAGAQGAQGAGPQDAEAFEAGESDGPDDGDEFENGDEMSAAGGFGFRAVVSRDRRRCT